MPSLKTNLTKYLEENGRITLDQLYLLCGKEHKKTSNAERRFREMMQPNHPSYNPNIKAERNEKGAIIAYVWKEKEFIFKATATTNTCCYSALKFFDKKGQSIHSNDCIIRQKEKICKEVNTLF